MRAALLRRRRRSLVDLTFITEWQTTTAAESITLPLISSGTYDFEVDWGDGSTDTITSHLDAAVTHTYADAGTRDVQIDGVCEGWNFFDVTTSKDAILDVKNWGALRLGASAPNSFRGCANLDVTAADSPNPVGITDLSSMLRTCPSLAGSAAFNKWDTSNVTRFFRTFDGSSSFSADISDWDVSSANTDMFLMFGNCSNFNADISQWDVSNCPNISQILNGASSFNQNLGTWPLRRAGVDMTDALKDTALSPENYSRTLIGWANYVASSPGGPLDVTLGAGTLTYNDTVYEAGATYTNAVDARNYLTTATLDGGAGWTITDGGLAV